MVYIKFTNKQNLKKHVESVHEGIKPFKCSICDVEFANKQNLKKHRKMLMKDSNHLSAVFVMLSLQITIIHRFYVAFFFHELH